MCLTGEEKQLKGTLRGEIFNQKKEMRNRRLQRISVYILLTLKNLELNTAIQLTAIVIGIRHQRHRFTITLRNDTTLRNALSI